MTEIKRRHGCLTLLLLVIILINSLYALIYLLGVVPFHFIFRAGSDVSVMLSRLQFVTAIFNSVFAVALLRWKRWGYWGLVLSNLLVVTLSVVLHGLLYSLVTIFFAVINIGLLWSVLQMGYDKNGWSQLE